jgi:hypothetical protein
MCASIRNTKCLLYLLDNMTFALSKRGEKLECDESFAEKEPAQTMMDPSEPTASSSIFINALRSSKEN